MSFNTSQEAAAIVGEKELIEISFPDGPEYFTTSRKAITLPSSNPLNDTGGDVTYTPSPIAREEVSSRHDGDGRVTKIGIPIADASFHQTLVDGGLGLVSVRITRGFGDPVGSPENFEKDWYQGTVAESEVVENILVATLRSLESYLEEIEVPRTKLIRFCQHRTYGDNGFGEAGRKLPACGLLEANFTYDFTIVSIDNTGTEIVVTADDPSNSGYDNPDSEGSTGQFTLGRLWAEDSPNGGSTMVVGHDFDSSSNRATFRLHSPLPRLSATQALPDFTNRVSASWGDDLTYETCALKFLNKDNFLGFNRVPFANPVVNPVFRDFLR